MNRNFLENSIKALRYTPSADLDSEILHTAQWHLKRKAKQKSFQTTKPFFLIVVIFLISISIILAVAAYLLRAPASGPQVNAPVTETAPASFSEKFESADMQTKINMVIEILENPDPDSLRLIEQLSLEYQDKKEGEILKILAENLRIRLNPETTPAPASPVEPPAETQQPPSPETVAGILTYSDQTYTKPGIPVHIYYQNGQLETETAADGIFEFTLPHDADSILVSIPNQHLKQHGLFLMPVKFSPVPELLQLDLLLAHPVNVNITERQTEKPLEDWSFTIFTEDPQFGNIPLLRDSTNARGSTRIYLPSQQFVFRTESWYYDQFTDLDKTVYPDDIATGRIEIEVDTQPFFTGTLEFESSPIAGIIIFQGRQFFTDEYGIFSVPADTDRLSESAIMATNDNGTLAAAFSSADLKSENNRIELIPTASVIARFTDNKGEPLDDITPKIGFILSETNWFIPEEAFWEISMDPQHGFRIDNIPLGLNLGINAAGSGYKILRLDDILPGTDTELGDIPLDSEQLKALGIAPQPELTGYIRDSAGNPYPDLQITAEYNGDFASAVTDQNGFFKIDGPKPDSDISFILSSGNYYFNLDRTWDGSSIQIIIEQHQWQSE